MKSSEPLLNFTESFRNSQGLEVAGTWFDAEYGKWRVSTVPVRGFETAREAVAFYHSNCDPLTGMLSMRRRGLVELEASGHQPLDPTLPLPVANAASIIFY